MMCDTFIVCMNHCIFSTLPLDVENTVIHTQSLKVAVSVGSGFMLLFCVRMYCVFSTLPLDVENTVIHTQSLKVMAFCVLERNIEKRAKT